MSEESLLEKLGDSTLERDAKREGAAIRQKWEQTGLLEGLQSDRQKDNMCRLLENQAKQLLKERSTMAGGDVEGFASVAFPIVRRVFGNLIAQDLVSVQPMSLPSGLIFFLDFQYDKEKLGQESGDSIYGGGVVGSEVTGGVDLTGENLEESFYSMNNGYSAPTSSLSGMTFTVEASGTVDGTRQDLQEIVEFDPDLSGSTIAVATVPKSDIEGSQVDINNSNLITFDFDDNVADRQIRRQTDWSGSADQSHIQVVLEATGSNSATTLDTNLSAVSNGDIAIADNFDSSEALGSVIGNPLWGLEDEGDIPEIDIKVDSVAVTAVTRKLKAKWTPELGQDLNAYHNLDAEVELTSILSEHVELEIDREIIENLVKDAEGGVLFWSRRPGEFVDRTTGRTMTALDVPPDFTGNVSEWYETLIETINEISARIHRKVRRGGATFLVCNPEVANILEFTAGFQAEVTVDEENGTAGTRKVGQINGRYDVYVDPYFHRNLILVGRKGSSFLETGFVYAPYVPLQITPTIFGVEDFVPRKGIMTRYAYKMVRPDMYGLVVVRDLNG